MLHVSQLSDRSVPAVVDLTGGVLTFTGDAVSNLTIYTSGSFYYLNDPSGPIQVTGGTVFGNGTTTARARIADVSQVAATGCDTINLRNVASGDSADLQANTVNICSNAPVNTGNLAGILGPVSVSGASTVVASNQSQNSGTYSVTVDASGVSGLLPGGDLSLSGTPSIRLIGSNNASISETFTINNPPGPLTISGNGGPETFNVVATTQPVALNGGAGADVFGIAGGILAAVDVDGGTGPNVVEISGSPVSSVVVTITDVTGFAAAPITYRSSGTTTLRLVTDVPATIHVDSFHSFNTLDLVGDWTVI